MKAPHTPPRTEGELQRWFVKELKEDGYLVYKFSSPAKKGVPDLVVISDYGAVSFIEMKHPNGKGVLSKLQAIEIKKLLANECSVYIIQSVDQCFDFVDNKLRGVLYADL